LGEEGEKKAVPASKGWGEQKKGRKTMTGKNLKKEKKTYYG